MSGEGADVRKGTAVQQLSYTMDVAVLGRIAKLSS